MPWRRKCVTDVVWLQLPIRLAHRIAELNSLPYGLNDAEGIQRVRDW